jgi:deoxyribose-phosphate aldolase
VGFPLGFTLPEVKSLEAERVIRNGAQEIDVVINLSALKSGDYELVEEDLRGVVKVAKTKEVATKVIIEACYLTDKEKVAACLLAEKVGADFVKTSTGFGPGGATVHDVQLMRRVLSDKIGVKAAGGIRTLRDVIKMVKAGASRIGTSHGVAIAKEVLAKRAN